MTTPKQAHDKRRELISKKRIIRFPDTIAMTGLGKTAIYDRIKAGTFPPLINLGGRAVGFLLSDVEQWIDERVKASQVA